MKGCPRPLTEQDLLCGIRRFDRRCAHAGWCVYCSSFWVCASSVEEGRRLVAEHVRAAHAGCDGKAGNELRGYD